MQEGHQSVLVEEVLTALAISPSDTVLDATVGGAGHFGRILSELGEGGTLIGIDADVEALERARSVVAKDMRPDRPLVHLINDNFRNVGTIINRLGVGQINKAIFDLGWSGYQLSAHKGFSFQNDDPLLMTYGDGEGKNAAEIVNTASESELADLLYAYGEERFARGIARAIVTARGRERILTTQSLVDAIMQGTPNWYQHRKIHPATKTFQALRIAANDELEALREALKAAMDCLAPGGKLAVISFHSIEDRIVKGAFRDAAHEGLGLGSKKPLVASPEELSQNRRARSAKLRVFEKTLARRSVISVSIPTYA